MDDGLTRLIRTGQFRTALEVVERLDDGTSPEYAVLRAELLERTGDLKSSKRAVSRALVATLPPPLHARCLNLSGTIELEEGLAERSIKTLQGAVTYAKQHSCLEPLCWAELRLLIALSELSPSDASAPLVTSLRRHASQLGNPVLTSALHVFASEVEAKRGALVTAARHSRVARALLKTHENLWIDGLTAIAEFCISFISDDLTAAHALAHEALTTYPRTGHLRTRIASLINLGHVHLKEGMEPTAERFLREALHAHGLTPRVRDSVTEGFAQLSLAQGDVSSARDWLAKLESSPNPELSYPRLWGCRTQVRLYAATHEWSRAHEHSNEGLRRAKLAGDRQLSSFLLLLRAEASAFLGNPLAAADDIVAALEGHAEPPLELRGEVQRVIGRALARQGDRVGAAEAFDRSVRILGTIGHLRAAKQAARQAADDGILVVPPDGRGTRVPAALPDHRPGLLVQRAAAIVVEATRPDLLATECIGVLAATSALRAAVVVSSDAGGERRMEFVHAWNPAQAEAALENPAMLTATLGTWRERDWALVADVSPGLDARTTWTAVRALATSGAALAAARRDAREREALWPIENPDLPTHGVFMCEQMQELHRTARKVASTDTLVLLTGETGVGKEVFARIIHDASPRAAKPFVPFNCSAVPREMLESQLFGHRRGAFTGADHDAPGVIRAAAGGTLFLDEIGDVAPELQPKLLRFLELGEIQPLGEPQPSKVDVRVVAATNRQLDELVREGRFREDLYFRLIVIPLPIPPLRERREEIPGLTEYFLRRFARESHKGHLRVANETMEYLLLYAWPGNVRQLMNEMRRLAAMAETDAVIMPEHLDRQIVASRRTRPASERDLQPNEVVVRTDQPLPAALEHLERTMIQQALAACHGRVEQAARMLGLSRKGLYLKRQRLGLDPEHE